jgi:hypothetical protein
VITVEAEDFDAGTRKQLHLLHNIVYTVSSVDALSADSMQLQHIARCIADAYFSSVLPHSDIYSNTV